MQVLRQLSKGLSNREIAVNLFVTPGTIKWYNKQIFNKLAVRNRTQAVSRAKEAGLLETSSDLPVQPQTNLRHNLPAQVNSFVGRKSEIDQIMKLLDTARLVTLSGLGGSGKTRLAIQVASQSTPKFRDGVWMVNLADLREPSKVKDAIAEVLNIDLSSAPSVGQGLKRFLYRKQLLLLLDNFEHLLDASPLVGDLLDVAPQLKILTTSRQRLHIYGEVEFTVNPLKLPKLERQQKFTELSNNEAVQLFTERTKSALPDFKLTPSNIQDIVNICVQLDGLPLALELCAPMIKIFPLGVISQRLAEGLDSLPEGPRNLPARHRTLQATLEWSINLLDSHQKILFRRMAVFIGGGTLESIEWICSTGLSRSTIDLLASLVDRNLVLSHEPFSGEMRFSMLETIREMNYQRLNHSGEAEQIHNLHATYYRELVEQAFNEFSTPKQKFWFAYIVEESDNIRAALNRSLLEGDSETSLRIIAALRDYWFYYALAGEGRRYAERVLQNAEQATPFLRAGALISLANFCSHLNDHPCARKYFLEALEIYEQLGDEHKSAWCLVLLSVNYLDTAKGFERGRSIAKKSLAIFRKFDDLAGISRAYNMLGELARLEGDDVTAEIYYKDCLNLCKKTGEVLRESFQYGNLGLIAYHKKEYQLSEELQLKGLRTFYEWNTQFGMATHIATLAGPIAALGNPLRAARILGAADVVLESLNADFQPTDQPEIIEIVKDVKSALGETAYKRAWLEGSQITIREAMRYVLGEQEPEVPF
jgi:predicted ATPase/DNA-binding CsgD family transcriptional regulator